MTRRANSYQTIALPGTCEGSAVQVPVQCGCGANVGGPLIKGFLARK